MLCHRPQFWSHPSHPPGWHRSCTHAEPAAPEGRSSADLVMASVALFKSSCFSKGRKQSHCLGTRSLTCCLPVVSRLLPSSGWTQFCGSPSNLHQQTPHTPPAAGLLNTQAASPLLPKSSCSCLGSSLCGAAPAPHDTVCAARWTFSSIELSSLVSLGNKLIHGCGPASSPCWAHGVLASAC